MGSIELIIGSMFSGKTTELIRRLNRFRIGGKNILLLRPILDNRGILTHDKIHSDIPEEFVKNIADADLSNIEIVGIDEGQFFTNLAIEANRLANTGKIVIISGLNATSEAEPFPEIQACIPISEHITKLNAVCTNCGSQEGSFTYFKAGNKTSAILVGEQEYTALCRECYYKLIQK